MLTMLISAVVAAAIFVLAHSVAGLGLGWGVTIGVLAFLALQFISGAMVKKRLQAVMERVQAIMLDGQKRLQTKMQRWQMRPPGSIQAAQKEIAADTRVFVKEALAATDGLDRFRWWVPLIGRQKATAQLQLNWMIKEFRKVDELMPKALFVDPSMSAIRMARMQMLDAPVEEIRRVYVKASRRLRYNQNVLLAGCWSWILVRRGLVDDAFKALTEALKNSDDATLRSNHAHLMNNKVAHFSNSGLGDRWYSLFLEEPKVRMQRQRQVFRQ